MPDVRNAIAYVSEANIGNGMPTPGSGGNRGQAREPQTRYATSMPLGTEADPVAKALWYIENNFAGDMTLGAVAAASGVSRFYLSRAFGETTGYSVMRYVRARR